MKIVQKLTLVLFSLFICQYQSAATSHTHFTSNFIDTIPQIEPEYKGNRILVKAIKVIKKKGKSYKIEYKLVNNGKNKVKLGKPSLIPKDLIIEFDKSLEENDLVEAKSSIIERIKKQSISIRPGQLIMGNKIKFTHQPIPPSDRIAMEMTNSAEMILDLNNNEEEISTHEEIETTVNEVPKTKFDKAVEDIVVEIPLPNTELESPRFPTDSSSIKEKIISQEPLLDETILVKEKAPSKKLVINDTESILEALPKEGHENEIRKVEIEITETEVIDSVVESEVIGEEETESSPKENPENEISDKKLCADLTIEDVVILRKNNRFVLVKYTVKNIGNIPISLHGETKKEIDNIAIQSHFTRSHNLTRGAIPVDTKFIKKGNRDKKGMLDPGETFSQKLKVEISKVTRFTPVLALTVNPISTNLECNRLNNIFFIDIADKAPEAIKSIPKQRIEKETSEKVTTLEN